MSRRPLLAFLIAACVIGVGLMAMSIAGAPRSLGVAQGGVGLVALVLAAAASRWCPRPDEAGARVVCVAALLLMAAPLAFDGIDGVQRWVALGPLQIQPAAITLPLVVAYVAQERVQWAAVLALMAAGVIGALQPDGQVLQGIIAVALCLALLVRGGVFWWSAVGISTLLGLTAAFGPPLAPVPYVEEVLPRAFEANWLFGVAAAVGLAAVPLLMVTSSPRRSATSLALAALWVGLIATCLSGAYPTPVLGYGLSWVVGFALSLGLASRQT